MVVSPAYGRVANSSMAFPDCFQTTLCYVSPIRHNTAAGPIVTLSMTNNAFDVDPLLGTTAMAGFGELALVYSLFRNKSMSITWDIENHEDTPKQIAYGPSIDVIASVGANYAENPGWKHGQLSSFPNAGSRKTFTNSCDFSKYYGDKSSVYSAKLSGSTSSNSMTTQCYMYLSLNDTAATVNGFYWTAKVCLRLEFYQRRSLVT